MLTKPEWGETPQVVENAKLDAMVEYSQSIHGAPIAEDAPANGDTLVYNSTSGEWEPAAGGAGASTPTGTGIPHIVAGVQQPTATKIVDADVDASAAIAISKIDGLQAALDAKSSGTHTHSAATTSAAGFLSAADKLKLDSGTDANTASTLVRRDASGNFKASTPVAPSDVATKAYADGLAATGAADADEVTKGITQLSVAPTVAATPIAVGDNDPRVSDFGASGTNHKSGLVPDPGVTEGSSRYLREDGTWAPLPVSGGEVTLTDAATIAIDASLSNVFTVSSATDRALGIPTNAAAGQTLTVRWKNTDSGAHTLSLTTGSAGAFRYTADVPNLPSVAAGKWIDVGAKYDSADDRWDLVSLVRGA